MSLVQVLDLSMAVMGATAEAVLQQPPQQPLPAHLVRPSLLLACTHCHAPG